MAQPVKQPININFAAGLNQKADPYQVPVGNFLELVNTVFDKVGRLTKRNGFPLLATLPDSTTSYLTTFNDDLQAIGANLLSYVSGQASWVNKGSVYPVRLSVTSLVRNAIQQSQGDAAIAPNGLICTVYTESNGSTTSYKYSIADSTTGQNVVEGTALASADSTYGTPRVWVLGQYFFIVYTKHVSSPYTLNYLAVSYINVSSTSTGQIAASYTPAGTVAFDGAILNNQLYLAYNGASGSGIKVLSISPLLTATSTVTIDGSHSATLLTLACDGDNQNFWVTYYDSGTSDGYTVLLSSVLTTLLSATKIISSETVLNLASTAKDNALSLFYEVASNYSYDSSIPSHFIKGRTCTSGGVLGTAYAAVRGVGLASKAFLVDGDSYFLSAFQSTYQSSYFLVKGTSTAAAPVVTARLAYSNGGGYLTTGLPSAIVDGTSVQIPYRVKDLLASQAASGAESIGLQPSPVYTQTGLNLVSLNFDTEGMSTAESANDLHLTGGLLWMYDGVRPIEHSFLLFPDDVEATVITSGGSITSQQYYYVVVYEWTDSQGNLFRSAPSIPVSRNVGSGSTNSVQIFAPTLRLTYKVSSPVRIVIYRWSAANPVYYRVTSITQPTQNSLTTDSITYTDTLADSSIIGNDILYTTGGVLENAAAPSSQSLSIFDNRLWLLDAEKDNVFWYSKEIIEGSPVDMSDLLTYTAVSPANAPGRTNFSFPMDDKLIQFKDNALCYTSGTGPTDTGANVQYSNPVFITSTVGSSNPRSVVMTPSGLMFQSNKGIWLLGRNLATSYIGAPVEDFNGSAVTSAQAIPETNQVRFTLDTGEVLMYDYFVGQWGVFEGTPAVSSVIYAGRHTLVNQYGQVSQETPDTYLDGPNPVLMRFKTSWLNVAGLRGYLRAYWFYFLGTFLSPHKLQTELAYDYNPSPVQSTLITPNNWNPAYGSTEDPYYGGDGSAPYGGPGSIEQERIFLTRQRCRAFQISIREVFDPTYGTVAGPGLTLSGLNCIVGVKKAYAPIPQTQQAG